MTLAHKRKDLEFVIVKGRVAFSRCAYACVITQSTAYPDERSVYHIEVFYGSNGVKLRAEARRYGRAIISGKRRVGGFRNQHLPHGFPCEGLPKREYEIEIREAAQ